MADLKIQQLDAIIPVTTNVYLASNDLFIVKQKARGTASLDEDRKLTWSQLVSSLQLGQYMPTAGGNFTGDVTLNNNIAIMGKQTGAGAAVQLLEIDASNTIQVGSPSNPLVLSSTVPPKFNDGSQQWDIITTKNLPTPGQLSGGAAYTKAETDSKDALKFDKTGGTVTGSIVVNNNQAYQSKKAAGTVINLATINSSDLVNLGDASVATRIQSSATPVWWNGTSTATFITSANLPTPGDINTYTKTEIDNKDAVKLNLAGGTMTGNLVLEKTILLRGTTSAGSLVTVAQVNQLTGSPTFGDTNTKTVLNSNVPPVWTNSTGTLWKIYSENSKPTTTELGIETRLLKADSAVQPGNFGIGGSAVRRTDAAFLSMTDKTEFISQDGSATEQRFGGLGAGVHVYYGTVGTGNATQYLSTSLFTRADGNVVSKFSTLDYQGNLVNTQTNELYGTLNKPSASDVGAYSKSEGDARYARQGVNSDITALNGLTGTLRVGANAINPLDVTTLQQVQAMTSGTAGAVVGVVGGFIGAVMWFNGQRANIPAGWVPADGQILNRVDYPDLWAAANAGSLACVTEAVWNTTVSNTRGSFYYNRASYSQGNGTSTFRVPDLNGSQTGSIGNLYLNGSTTALTGNIGQARESAAPPIVGSMQFRNMWYMNGSTWTNASMGLSTTGALSFNSDTYQTNVQGPYALPSDATHQYDPSVMKQTFDASRSDKLYTGSAGELRPNTAVGIWIIRASNSFAAANTDFTVYNGAASMPSNGTAIAGGSLVSNYSVGGVPEATATFKAVGTVGQTYGARIITYNKTANVTKNFDFGSDGNLNVPGTINLGRGAVLAYSDYGLGGATTVADANNAKGYMGFANGGGVGSTNWYDGYGSCLIMNRTTVSQQLQIDRVSGAVVTRTTTDGNSWSPWMKTLMLGDYGVGTVTVPKPGDATAQYIADSDGATLWGPKNGAGFQSTYANNRLFQFMMGTDGTAYYRYNDSGNAQVAKTTKPWTAFTMAGTSDINYKDVQGDLDVQVSLDNINKMQFKNFTYKDDDEKTPRRGIIAQDAELIDPEYVHSAGGKKSLDLNPLVLDALAAIQALSKQVEELKAQLAAK